MIISKFNDLQNLNEYYLNSFNSDKIFPLTAVHFALLKNGMHSLIGEDGTADNTSTQIQEWISENNINLEDYTPLPNTYFYLGSKTNYRNEIHPFVVDSTYKKLYTSLKKHSYISEANGTYVILRKDQLMLDVYNETQIPEPNLDLLENILLEFKSMRQYVKYYDALVKNLLLLIEEKDETIISLSNKISDDQLSSWA